MKFLEADIFAPPHYLKHLFHKTTQHNHINIMSKKVHSRRAIADVKDAFLEVVRHYRQNVSPWYYYIKLEGRNPHSFAAALVISSVKNMMSMLVEFGVATKF